MSASPASITSTGPDHIDGSRPVSNLPNLPAQLIRLSAINARLEAVLAKVLEEVREFPDAPPESSDSYLPPHLVVEIAEALHYARAR
jgi:hypothetical protein